jgi:hypothetical protein
LHTQSTPRQKSPTTHPTLTVLPPSLSRRASSLAVLLRAALLLLSLLRGVLLPLLPMVVDVAASSVMVDGGCSARGEAGAEIWAIRFSVKIWNGVGLAASRAAF